MRDDSQSAVRVEEQWAAQDAAPAEWELCTPDADRSAAQSCVVLAELAAAALVELPPGLWEQPAEALHFAAVQATEDWGSCVRGADIVVEAARLPEPAPLLRTEWIARGALVVPYGTMSAVELSLTDVMDKIVVDDWGQCRTGPFGALRAHVEAGKLTEATLHAELCQIVVGDRPGRERDDETILFWHRGLSLSDIALGHAMLEKARRLGIGQALRYA